MSGIFNTPFPGPPADLAGLGLHQIQNELGILHPNEWREYIATLHDHAQRLHVTGVHLQAEIETLKRQRNRATSAPTSPGGSEISASSPADPERRIVKEIRIYLASSKANGLKMKAISNLIILETGTENAWQISGPFDLQVTNWIETGVVRTFPEEYPLGTQVQERELADHYNIATIYCLSNREMIWVGPFPEDDYGKPAKLVLQKQGDEYFVLPLLEALTIVNPNSSAMWFRKNEIQTRHINLQSPMAVEVYKRATHSYHDDYELSYRRQHGARADHDVDRLPGTQDAGDGDDENDGNDGMNGPDDPPAPPKTKPKFTRGGAGSKATDKNSLRPPRDPKKDKSKKRQESSRKGGQGKKKHPRL